MKILLTGSLGYIGSKLVQKLLHFDHEVIGIDNNLYASIDEVPKHIVHIKSIAKVSLKDLLSNHGIECIIHLSGLSNDPSADFDPKANEQINHDDTVRLAQVAKGLGIKRFIYASSASVYGTQDDFMVTEKSYIGTSLSAYASSKVNSENSLISLSDESFKPIILRKGTLMGSSFRMRLDLVVNQMVLSAYRTGKIILNGGGENWRPLIDINDVCNIYRIIATCPEEQYNKADQIYNVVSENYRISELGFRIQNILKKHHINCTVEPDYRIEKDKRTYRMNGNKLNEFLNYGSFISLDMTVHDILTWIYDHEDLDNLQYYNIKWIQNCQKVCKSLGHRYDLCDL